MGMVPSPLHLSASDPSSHVHSQQGGSFGASLHWACGWASAVLPPHATDEGTYRQVKQEPAFVLGPIWSWGRDLVPKTHIRRVQPPCCVQSWDFQEPISIELDIDLALCRGALSQEVCTQLTQ